MIKRLIQAIISVVIFCTACGAATVAVQGRRILVDGKQFDIKGVCYSPAPVGYNWQYLWCDVPGIYDSDLPLIKSLGANTIRTYHERNISKAFLDNAAQNGIYVIVGWGENLWNCDFTNATTRAKFVNDFADFINLYKNHPAVLMWNFGNEVEEHTINKASWYTLVQEACVKAHSVDPNHPVTTANQETTEVGGTTLNADDATLSALDVWGVNVYRGKDFDSAFFTEMGVRTAKPYFISEWGCDAFNGVSGSEDQGNQDIYIRSQWADIASNLVSGGKDCSGAALFEWCDEWWKGDKVPGDITTISQGGLLGNSYHDTGSDWTNTAYESDRNMNEEWWGIVSVSPGSSMRTPRLAYYSLRDIWNPTTAPVATAAGLQNEVRNYPNPFIVGRDTTRVEFTVSGSPDVEVVFFDLRGNKIYQQDNLVNLGSGRVAADWDGKDMDNNFVCSGLYICRVTVKNTENQETKYRKIAVVK